MLKSFRSILDFFQVDVTLRIIFCNLIGQISQRHHDVLEPESCLEKINCMQKNGKKLRHEEEGIVLRENALKYLKCRILL